LGSFKSVASNAKDWFKSLVSGRRLLTSSPTFQLVIQPDSLGQNLVYYAQESGVGLR